jgi:hypothetical protein
MVYSILITLKNSPIVGLFFKVKHFTKITKGKKIGFWFIKNSRKYRVFKTKADNSIPAFKHKSKRKALFTALTIFWLTTFGKFSPNAVGVDLPIKGKSSTEIVVQGSNLVLISRPELHLKLNQHRLPGPSRAIEPAQVPRRPRRQVRRLTRTPSKKIYTALWIGASAAMCGLTIESGSYDTYRYFIAVTTLGMWLNK